jgi:RecB family exonuclease
VADVAELFTAEWVQRRGRRLLSDVVWPVEQAPTPRELARAQAVAREPVGAIPPEPERRLGPRALARLRHTEIVSAGALESYAECPVRWLVERELRPAALEPEPEPIVRGNLMHLALERVLAELGGALTPASLDQARAILDRVLPELTDNPAVRLGVGRPDVVRAGALRAIEADLRRYLEHEARNAGPWRPLHLELRFGFDDREDSLPALELGEGPERVRIRGAIDRVDVDGPGRAIIRDYKSGSPRPGYTAARWVADHQLQVALYLIVVRELTGLEPAAGFYQPLRGDDLRPRGMFLTGAEVGAAAVNRDAREPEAFAAALEETAGLAVELAAALRSGALTPCPRTCTRDGCAFPGICRSQ